MTAGNVNVSSNRDGLVYISYESVNRYRSSVNKDDVRSRDQIKPSELANFSIDLNESQKAYDDWLARFKKAVRKKYPSLKDADTYITKTKHIVLSSAMFEVIIEDNDWGFAVELISHEKCPFRNLQKHLFPYFFNGMIDILLNQMHAIYLRNGSWSVEQVTPDTKDKVQTRYAAGQMTIDKKWKPTGGYNDQNLTEREVSTDTTD